MKLISLNKILTALAIAVVANFSVYAMDLPKRLVNGKEYYYYEVKNKETIYGICRDLGITKAQLVKFNPSVADGLRSGVTLYFPVDEMDNAVTESTPKAKPETAPAHQTVSNSSSNIHLVQKGETIYGISRHYGMTQDELIALNPSIVNGLKQGTILHIKPTKQPEASQEAVVPPAPEAKEMAQEEEQNYTTPVSTIDNPVAATPAPSDTEADDPATDEEETNLAENATAEEEETVDEEEPQSVKVAVMLPFMLNQSSPDKQAQLYTEFYKGFLLAVDSLRNINRQVEIMAFDTADNLDTLNNILSSPQLEGVSVIISPDNEQQLNAINRYAVENDVDVLNIFAVKSELYRTSPQILQANIPHTEMYRQAIKGFMDMAAHDYTPVFISSPDGKNEKNEFLNMLKAELGNQGREYVDITYSGHLKESDLASLDKEKQYIFIPASGTLSEFNRIISALKNYREALLDYNLVRMFGYPEWITFRGDALESLHLMNSFIYSRFFNDEESYRTTEFNNSYKKWYGTSVMSAVPVQGILGFDTAFFLLKAIQRNPDNITDSNYTYNGIQSGYHFVKQPEHEGEINDILYLINFRPSGISDKRIIE